MSNQRPGKKRGGGGGGGRDRAASRLFSTLASVERADASASKRRELSRRRSLRRSRAAADQAKLSGILLELRILTQRCLTEERSGSGDGDGDGAGGDDGGAAAGTGDDGSSRERAREEADALLENLLAARRELAGNRLDGLTEGQDDGNGAVSVDYGKLIQRSNGNGKQTEEGSGSSDDEDSSPSNGSGSSEDGDDSSNSNLAGKLQSEYASLRDHWKTTLNRHHSNLAIHSGMAANSSKFQSRAVDVSFWEQVEGGAEHELFKQKAADEGGSGEGDVEGGVAGGLRFDDSKLYQQMLKDFISSSQADGGATSGTNKRGATLDPAHEAAERLRRAMRKKSGCTGDVDLTSLLTDGGMMAGANGLAPANGAKRKAATAAAAVDRRASKGRKIRYAVHPKLVNFTFPVARPEPAIGEDVWFKSLFGGVGRNKL